MDDGTVQSLCDLNSAFYRAHHESFSDTRRTAWPGWQRVAELLRSGAHPLRILDIACGNMRFEAFLDGQAHPGAYRYTCVDSCPELAVTRANVCFRALDVLGAVRRGDSLIEPCEQPYDAVVSFGFMHHVPTFQLRAQLLWALLECVRPQGVLVVSFWRFMDDERLARRARETTRVGCAQLGLALDENDYLLGWNGVEGAYRYCHHFTEGEIMRLADEVAQSALLESRFDADGRSGALNGYAVFRRR